CQKIANVPDSAAGKNVRCSCGSTFPIPNPADLPKLDDLELSPVVPTRSESAGNFVLPEMGTASPRPLLHEKPPSSAERLLDSAISSIAFLTKAAVIVLILGGLGVAGYLYKRNSDEEERKRTERQAGSTP